MIKKQKVYTKGSEDVERVMEHLADAEKKAKRAAWLKEHYSKSNKGAQPKKEN